MKPKAEIKAVLVEIEDLYASYQKEQEESEDNHAKWENSDDKDAEEPDVINNSESIKRLDRAINFLEKAVAELDD